MNKIAIDAMGGDYAPTETVKGALAAVRRWRIPIVLVGDEAQIRPLVEAENMTADPLVELVHTSQVIGMDEHPGMAYRKKKDSSIVRCAELVKTRACGAMVAPGSTGAAVTAGLLGIGRVAGIRRPAIATTLPREDGGRVVLVDSGASANADADALLQNALMGDCFARAVYHWEEPRIGLLNIGTEEIKGSVVVTEAYTRMKSQDKYRFIGNVEGRDITSGKVDVVVCDGFTGNVVLKFAEGLVNMFFRLLKEAVASGGLRAKLGAVLLKPVLKGMLRSVDYAEYGGAPLLGIKGGLVICHGASKAKAIQNAVRMASQMAEADVSGAVANAVASEEKRFEEKTQA